MDSNFIGKWVAVRYSYAMTSGIAGIVDLQHAYGILDSADDVALLVRQPRGDTLYIPASTVRAIEVIEPAENGPGGTLLRAADPSSGSDSLLRPAMSSNSIPETLLRPMDDGN